MRDVGFDYNMADVFNNERFAVMQFTGLLDKNGKEIYEGDIVEDSQGYYWISDESDITWKVGTRVGGTKREDKEAHYHRYVVEYKNEDAGFYPLSSPSFGGYEWENVFFKDATVIGNIYENPELLTN